MKRQVLAIKINKHSEQPMLLSAMLLTMGGVIGLPAGAQLAGQDSCLPPEVIPVNASVNYTPAPVASPASSSSQSVSNVPAVQAANTTSVAAAQPAIQTAQEARQAIFNSLMGTNVYPQFSGGNFSFNQNGNMGGANVTQGMSQTLSNSQSGQFNSSVPSQYNNLMSAAPGQTQTLSGSVNTPSTSQPRTSGGIGRIGGLLAGVGLEGASLINSSPGNIFSAGELGASMLGNGVRSGFSF